MEKESFYDKRFSKKYIFRYSEKFIRSHGLSVEKLQADVLHYLEHYYFTKKEQYFKASITKDNTIGYHKIEIQLSGQSRRSGGRIMTFFIIPDEEHIAYIIPAFFFSVQEEKTYTTNKLTSPQFGNKLLQKLDNFKESDMKEITIRTPNKGITQMYKHMP